MYPNRPNGGLYTGVPAYGPWGAVPVVPEATSMTYNTLKSEVPQTLVPGGQTRPGNNTMDFGNRFIYNPQYNIACVRPASSSSQCPQKPYL